MSAEYMAERLGDLLIASDFPETAEGCVYEDKRNGDWFFEAEPKGRKYQVTVTELRSA